MASARLNYRILWSPYEDSNLFLLGSSNELRLYEYLPKTKPKLAFASPLVAKLANMKSFSWSPDPTIPGLIAAGFANGKIYIYNLYEESILSEPNTSPPEQQPYMVLNSKNPKPCNELVFSPDEPNLLATGFDRNRNDHSLLIWDVEKSKLSALIDDKESVTYEPPNRSDDVNINVSRGRFGNQGFNDPLVPMFKFSVYNPPIVPVSLPAPRVDTHSDAMHSFGLSENVNSISWFPKKKQQLVSGMIGKHLRIFDLRLKDNPTTIISTKAVFGIKTDPHNDHRFASFEEPNFGGNINLWDDRKTAEPVLSISTEMRPVRISFSPSQSGLLATLFNDASHISLYDIKETTRLFSTTYEVGPDHFSNGFGGDGGMRHSIMGGTSGYVMDYNTNGIGAGESTLDPDEFEMPVLWKSRKSQRSLKSLISFAWIPTISSPHSYHLLAMNKDITFETITLKECPNFDWGPLGNLLTIGASSYNVDPSSNVVDKKTDVHNNNYVDQNKHHNINDSLKVGDVDDSGDRTPRPGDSSKDPSTLLKGITIEKKGDEKKPLMSLKALEELQEDISVIMRKRANEGYSMNCQINEEIVKDSPKLKELWNWISRAENYTLEAKSDAAFQGIHVILASANNRFDQVADINENFVMESTSKLNQRKTALTICEWGLGRKELGETIQGMERAGNYEKAAGWAFFHGKFEKAINVLQNSEDEKLKLVSTALASYASNMNEKNPLWVDMCKHLSREMRDPYLRAIFSFIASGNWLDVLQEEELALQDRIGIALRFLNDDELEYFINNVTTKVVADGDIGGIILTGLTLEGVSLFENYVNNTCDVQTASLAMSFCVPKKFKDTRVTAWIEEYRALLDQWKMFDTRAKFDIARGKHMSSALEFVPPQIFVRCNFCTSSVSHNLWIQGMKKGVGFAVSPGTNGMISYRQKATCCPGCLKPLPRCSICLLSLGTPKEENKVNSYLQNGTSKDKKFGFDLWFTWCQSCRHGGHAIHMLQWFEKHKACPVSECSCECKIAT